MGTSNKWCLRALLRAFLASAYRSRAANLVTFKNGDQLTGKIETMEGGKLSIKTAVAGKVTVDLKDVKTFSSDGPIEIRLNDGTVLHQKVAAGDDGKVALAGGDVAAQSLPIASVKSINPALEAWTGTIAVGGTLARGNTDAESFNASLHVVRRGENDRITADAGYLWGRQRVPGVSGKHETENDWFIAPKYDYFFTPKFYGYANARVEKDIIANLSLLFTPGVGVGYQWIEKPDMHFSTEGGVSWLYRDFRNDGTSDSVAVRLAYHFDKKFDDKVAFFHNFEYYPALDTIDNYFFDTDAGVRTTLTERMFAEFKTEYKYNSIPVTREAAQRSAVLAGRRVDVLNCRLLNAQHPQAHPRIDLRGDGLDGGRGRSEPAEVHRILPDQFLGGFLRRGRIAGERRRVLCLRFTPYLSHKPADADHPYGHGKVEFISAAVEGGMVLAAALVSIVKAIDTLLHHVDMHTENLLLGLGLLTIALVVNGVLGIVLVRVGRKQDSATLVADGRHLWSDAITSLAAVVALGLVKITGWRYADPLAAIVVAIYIAMLGVELVRGAIAGLMDRQDASDQDLLTSILDAHVNGREPRICSYHKLRHRHNGRYHWVDFHIMVPPEWDVRRGHQVATAQLNMRSSKPWESATPPPTSSHGKGSTNKALATVRVLLFELSQGATNYVIHYFASSSVRRHEQPPAAATAAKLSSN